MNGLYITTVLVLFPLWAQIWESRPFTLKDMDETALPSYSAEMLRDADAYLQHSDLVQKESFLRILVAHPVAEARKLALKHLAREKDERVIALILSLLPPGDDLSPALLAAYLKSSSPLVVESAIRLYAALPESKPDQLLPFLSPTDGEGKELSPAVRLAAWRCFADRQDYADFLGTRVCEFQDDELPEVRMQALTTALKQKTTPQGLAEWCQKVIEGQDPLAKLALASLPKREFSPQIAILSTSPETALRLRLAQHLNGDFLSLLTTLCGDSQSAVRSAALTSLGGLLTPDNANDLSRFLFAALDDEAEQVRVAARNALAAAMENCPSLHDQAVELLSSETSSAHLRLGLYSLVRAPKLVKSLLPEETNPENIVAAIDSLRLSAESGSCGELLLPLTKYRAPTVREAAAKAIGYLKVPSAEQALIRLTSLQEPLPVRIAAYEAMGRNPSLAYSDCLLNCLAKAGKTTPDERAAAAWSCGHILSSDNDEIEDHILPLAQQMLIQCTKPVVPMMGMMSFDDNSVISNCIYALGNYKRHLQHPEIADLAQRVLNLYNTPEEEVKNLPPMTDMPPLNELTYSLAHQLVQSLNGEIPEQQRHPLYKVTLPCERFTGN